MDMPSDRHYTLAHIWVKQADSELIIGITDIAQEALGDIVFIDLPSEGEQIDCGDAFGSIESNKAVSDLFAPVTGYVKQLNPVLADTPEIINQSPYEQGWILRLCDYTQTDLGQLLSMQEYLNQNT